MPALRSRTLTWRFDCPPEAIWPVLADTARVNEAAGLPRHEVVEVAQPDQSVRFFATARRGPIELAWEEIPVEWVWGQWFRHERVFSRGPLARLIATLRLEPDNGGGTLARYTVEAAPRTLLGTAILATRFFRGAQRTFDHLANLAAAWKGGHRDSPFDPKPYRLTADKQARMASTAAQIESSGNGHGLAERLTQYLIEAQELDLARIRPLAVAAAWHRPATEVIELCLQAVADGLLELRWDLLCPRCRGAKLSVTSLDRLPRSAHCGSCNIRYDRGFARNVEVTFRPAEWLRPIADGEFCLFGPMTTPHILAQVTLPARTIRELPVSFTAAPLRLRTLETGGQCEIDWHGGSFPTLELESGQVSAGPPAGPGVLRIDNRESRPLTAIVEDRSWIGDALTADRVTSMQAFRDLFPRAGLEPGDEAPISHMTLMFSDLQASTALYERIGDVAAYRLVREHFAFMTGHIRANQGGVVKTIGDAVMAAFAEPADAVRAALAIQREIASFNAGQDGDVLVIKLGLHMGPCVAVTLNDRLDYFGGAVNMAARLQSQSAGDDIVLSSALAADPAVTKALNGIAMQPDSCHLKGFAEPVTFYRVTGLAEADARV